MMRIKDLVQKRSFWIGVIIVVKTTLFFFFHFQYQKHYPSRSIINDTFVVMGETGSYYIPVEHYAEGKGYSMEKKVDGEHPPSTRRMPGILPIYYPLYTALGKVEARTVMIHLQFLIGILAVYALARTAERIFDTFKAFAWASFLFSISSFYCIFHHMGLMESLSNSFLIFAFFFLFKTYKGNPKHPTFLILLTGIFGTWSVFLRPATGLIFLPMGLLALYYDAWCPKTLSVSSLKRPFLLALPLLIGISLWTYRNYQIKDRFIPLQDDVSKSLPNVYPPQKMAIRDLIKAWGGEYPRWVAGSVGQWFHSKKKDHSCLKERMFAKGYDLDSLIKLRETYQASLDYSLPTQERKKYARRAVRMAKRFKKIYKEERPLQYYLISKLVIAKKFLLLQTTNYLPFPQLDKMGVHHILIKGGYIVYYNLLFFGSLVGTGILIRRRHIEAMLLFSFPLTYILVIAMTGRSEERYLLPLYPFWILYASFLMYWLSESRKGIEQALGRPSKGIKSLFKGYR